MEIPLFLLAILLNPIVAALFDYIRETRRETRQTASAQDDWQTLVNTMRAEYERQLSNARGCPDQLRIANGIIERLMNLQPVGTAGGVNIINAASGASIGQAGAGRDISQGKSE